MYSIILLYHNLSTKTITRLLVRFFQVSLYISEFTYYGFIIIKSWSLNHPRLTHFIDL